MKKINLAISCVGSGIGQSIIDSCKLSDLPITTFGLDRNPFAYGLYDCDYHIQTPSINTFNYLDNLIEICLNNNIHIIIPGTDEEVHLFSKNIETFNNAGIKVIVSSEIFLDLVRDKVKTNSELSSIADIFVKSYYNVYEFLKDLNLGKVSFPVIAKPGSGSGSVGVQVLLDESDLEDIPENHIIQEIARPHKNDINIETFDRLISKKVNSQVSEISIHLVADKQGNVIGRMVSYNKLKNGVPVEVIPYDGLDVWDDIEKLFPTLKTLGLRGPLNIQGRMTDEGFKIFEMNARFTGITGLRACMGFNEVEACIKEWLDIYEKPIELRINNNVFGVRQITNKVINFQKNPCVKPILNSINNSNTKPTKILLITGATGFLGRNLIDTLLEQKNQYTIWALVRDKVSAIEKLPKGVIIFDNKDLEQGIFSLGTVDTLLHLGFARSHKSAEEIAKSVAYTAKLFRRAVENHVSNIINISSQSVYGQASLPPWKENSIIAPNTTYATAKYTTELLLNELSHQHKHVKCSSVRLTGIIGGANGLVNIDLVSKFVERIKNNKDLNVVGGMQIIERLDIRDAVSGLIALLNTPSNNWKPVYNLGSGKTLTLLELSKKIVKIGKQYNKLNGFKINLEEKHINMKFGMDISSFKKDTNWKPQFTIEDTIHSLFKFDY